MSSSPRWIGLALASGASAAINGVFAKLTTTQLTASIAASVAGAMGLARDNRVVELGLRGVFFALNLAFNAIMWALFTMALARGSSTTRVSIVSTSSNFMATAILGLVIFAESLPPLWWIGAALLVAGTVIIGRKEEGVKEGVGGGAQAPATRERERERAGRGREGETEDLLLDAMELEEEDKKGDEIEEAE